MLRWLGAGLIVCGGVLARHAALEGDRRVQRTRRALFEAFEGMEAEIRLLLVPMPRLLRRRAGGEAFFTRAARELAQGAALAEAWRDAAAALELPEEERESVASMGARLGGGEESACGALLLAASALRRAYERDEAKRGERERLITSTCVGISLFLAILLL